MEETMLNRIYKRMKLYSFIHSEAVDTPEIANLAYKEVAISFLELIFKFDGFDWLQNRLLNEEEDRFLLKIAGLILPIDQNVAGPLINSCLSSKDESCKMSAENMSDMNDDLIRSYNEFLQKTAHKNNIKIELS